MNIKMTTPTLKTAMVVTLTILTTANNIIVGNADDIERLPPINNPRIHDTNEYRGIKLANGLQVLLIRDTQGSRSAVTMAVRIGAMNDVKENPGIANILRYLLLVANGKYSNKYEFKKFLQKHRGKLVTDFTYNDAEHKQYFSFEISSNFLPQALKRFAQYFIDPVFQGVGKMALRDALGDMFKKHERLMSTNKMRIDRLLKSLSEEGHPFSNLTYGTVEMLNKYAGVENGPLDALLSDFHSKWYSANLMCLVVMGTENLDSLEQMVSESFRGLKNSQQEKLVFTDEQHPWKSDQVGHKIYIVPAVDKIRAIQLTFPVPDVLHQYKISPGKYVIRLINHGGPGTLAFVLQKKGLCKRRSLHAEYRVYAGIGFFHILMDLTEKGLKQIDYILGLTFQYIYLLKKEGVQEWFYNENKRFDELNFGNQSISFSKIQHLASAMHDYPIQDILTHEFIRDPFERTSIDNFLSYLRPNKVKISVIDKSFGNIVDNTEPWYGTKYKIQKLSPKILREWDSPSDLYPELGIPIPNEFIPDDLNVNIPISNEEEPPYPSIIHASSLSRIWYKSEKYVWMYRIVIEIVCPLANINPLNRLLTNIFVRMLTFSLEEYEYFAKSVAISYNISPIVSGFQVSLTGTKKMSNLLERILVRMLNFEKEMKKEDFKKAKEQELKYVQEFPKTKESYPTAVFHAACMRNEINWLLNDIVSTTNINNLKYEKMKNFPVKLLSRIYIQGLIQGNCDREEATQIANIIGGAFISTSHKVLPQEILYPRIVQIDPGKQIVLNTFSDSAKHCYYAFFQVSSPYTTRDYTIGNLLFDINFETCANILPLKELGISTCDIENVGNTLGFAIKIISTMHPQQMDMRVERFLEIIKMKLENISDSDFNALKFKFGMQKMVNRINKLPEHDLYWREIIHRNYDFELSTREDEIISELNRKGVLDFFQEFYAKDAPKRRKLAVYVTSKKLIQSTPENIATEEINGDTIKNIKIEEILKYRNSSRLYPIAVPDLVHRR